MLKDAWKKAHGITSSFKFNDHQGITQMGESVRQTE